MSKTQTYGFGYSMNIYVGPSKDKSKEIFLPYAGMFVEPLNIPRNLMKNRWTSGQFKMAVDGKKLRVTREDRDRGWGSDLTLRAFYSKNALQSHSFEYDAEVLNEGSAVTVRLYPDQKILIEQSSLLFKGEAVTMSDPHASVYHLSQKIPNLFKGLNETIRNSPSKDNGKEIKARGLAQYIYDGGMGTNGLITFGAEFPSKVMHLSVGEYGNRLIFRHATYLAISASIKVLKCDVLDSSFRWLVGSGDVFLKTGPTIKRVILKQEETIAVRQDCLVAFTQDVLFTLHNTDKFKGIFDKRKVYRRLTGPGVAWIDYRQSNILVENIDDEQLSIGSDEFETVWDNTMEMSVEDSQEEN